MMQRIARRPPQRRDNRGIQEQIKKAATELFCEVPFTDVSVEDLIRSANVSRATFYAYYPNKAAILRAIVEEDVQRHALAYERLAALPIEEKALCKWFEHLGKSILQVTSRLRLFQLATSIDAGTMESFSAARELYIAILARRYPGFDASRGDPATAEDRRIAATFFLLQVEQYVLGMAHSTWPLDVQKTAQHLAGLLLQAAGSDEP